MFEGESLEVAEFAAALVIPGSRASAVLQGEVGAGEIVGSIVNWGDSQH